MLPYLDAGSAPSFGSATSYGIPVGEGARPPSHTGKGGSGAGGIPSKTHPDHAMLQWKWGGGGVCGGAAVEFCFRGNGNVIMAVTVAPV